MSARLVVMAVSPHLDDAALSLGGTLAGWADAGARVVIVSVFAGDAPDGQLTAFARSFHATCGLRDEDAVAVRRAEDIVAAERLGAETVHLPFVDAVYRRDSSDSLVATEADLFHAPAAPDLANSVADALAQLRLDLRATTLIGPCAVGGHVDHRITRAGALAAGCDQLYEELPYASRVVHGVNSRISSPQPVTPAMWARKLSAVRAYTSQHKALAASTKALETELALHARTIGGGIIAERLMPLVGRG